MTRSPGVHRVVFCVTRDDTGCLQARRGRTGHGRQVAESTCADLGYWTASCPLLQVVLGLVQAINKCVSVFRFVCDKLTVTIVNTTATSCALVVMFLD